MSDSDLAGNLENYIKNRIPNTEALGVDNLQRIHGGASRKTYQDELEPHPVVRAASRWLRNHLAGTHSVGYAKAVCHHSRRKRGSSCTLK